MSDKNFIDLTGWDEADEFNSLPPSGQICSIVNAHIGTSKAGNETLYVDIDISQGEYKGFFAQQSKKFGDKGWSSFARLSIPLINKFKGGVHFRVKKFLIAVQESNSNLNLDPASGKFDIRDLRGKSIGIVFKGKESKNLKKDGTRFINAVADQVVTTKRILTGDFTVPATEPFSDTSAAILPSSADDLAGTPVDDGDYPF